MEPIRQFTLRFVYSMDYDLCDFIYFNSLFLLYEHLWMNFFLSFWIFNHSHSDQDEKMMSFYSFIIKNFKCLLSTWSEGVYHRTNSLDNDKQTPDELRRTPLDNIFSSGYTLDFFCFSNIFLMHLICFFNWYIISFLYKNSNVFNVFWR